MRITKLALACCCLFATATASAQTTPDPAVPPTPPTTPAPPPPPPAPPPDPNAPPQPLGGTGDQPPVSVQPQPQPQPLPQPPAQPQPAPPPPETRVTITTTTTTPPTASASKPDKSHWTRRRCKGGSDSYYKCERGHGIFHSSRLAIGALSGDAATTTMDPTGNATTSYGGVTAGQIAFEGAYLGVPSSFAPTNFHGIEFSTGLRSSKFDFWMSFGTAFTLLNVGSGGMGTFRLGGSFGAGFDLAHGYGYIKGRGAMIILPERLDVEFSAQWTPVSASTDHYDVQAYRISAWYRLNEKSKRAVELYVEKLTRKNTFRPDAMDPALAMFADDREILDGVGFGVGMSFF